LKQHINRVINKYHWQYNITGKSDKSAKRIWQEHLCRFRTYDLTNEMGVKVVAPWEHGMGETNQPSIMYYILELL
jgi:hypothetical protein